MLSSIYSNQKQDYPKFIISKNVKENPFMINNMIDPSINYIAILESEEIVHTDSDDDSESSVDISKSVVKHKNVYPTLAHTYENSTPPSDPFSLGKDPIKTFYIGSITVVGLYILYKILNKR